MVGFVANRAAYMPRRRELAQAWADMLSDGLPDPSVLIERPVKAIGMRSRRSFAPSPGSEFRFPVIGGKRQYQYCDLKE